MTGKPWLKMQRVPSQQELQERLAAIVNVLPADLIGEYSVLPGASQI